MNNRLENSSVRVALYARSASDDQRGSKARAQIALCRERAIQKHWSIVAEYADASVSGRSSELPSGLLQVLRQAEAGELDAVLVTELNRLSCDHSRLMALIRELNKHGVEVTSLENEPQGAIGIAELLRRVEG